MSVSHELGLKLTSLQFELSLKKMGSKTSRFSNRGVHWENHNNVYRRNQEAIRLVESRANARSRNGKFASKWGISAQDCLSPALKSLHLANFEVPNGV